VLLQPRGSHAIQQAEVQRLGCLPVVLGHLVAAEDPLRGQAVQVGPSLNAALSSLSR
jgi:hypothetical protein